MGVTVDEAPFKWRDIDFDTDPWVAVRVTVCEVTTGAMVAANCALVAPDGTVTEAGMLTALLLLASETDSPLLEAGAPTVTEQLSVPAPIIDVLEQLSAVRELEDPPDQPWPWSLAELANLTAADTAVTLSSAVVSVVVPGSKLTWATMLVPAFNVAGKVLA